MTNLFTNKPSSKQKGISLIEVIISVFVFAIGVLGFASLQTRSLQGSFDNSQREQVVMLSNSLISRIKASNRDNPAAGIIYTNQINSFTVNSCVAPTSCAQTSGSVPAACNAAQIVAFDVWDELCGNPTQGAFVVKDLEVNLDCGAGNCVTGVGAQYDLSVTWCARTNDTATGAGGDDSCTVTSQMSYTQSFIP